MAALGKGYGVWVANAHAAILLVDDIPVLIENIIENFNNPNKDNIKRFLVANYVHGKSLHLTDPKGPCGTLNAVRSADYPQEAKFIQAIFQPTFQAPNITPQRNIMLSLPGDVRKDAKAKTGMTKLLLFHITADINLDAGTFSNLQQAVPLAGMAVILAMPRAARAQAYSDLLRKLCLSAAMQDPFSI